MRHEQNESATGDSFCVTDEGRSLGVALQQKAPNRHPPLWAKAMGVSSEGISKPRFVRRLRDEFRRNVSTGGAVSGISVA